MQLNKNALDAVKTIVTLHRDVNNEFNDFEERILADSVQVIKNEWATAVGWIQEPLISGFDGLDWEPIYEDGDRVVGVRVTAGDQVVRITTH